MTHLVIDMVTSSLKTAEYDHSLKAADDMCWTMKKGWLPKRPGSAPKALARVSLSHKAGMAPAEARGTHKGPCASRYPVGTM